MSKTAAYMRSKGYSEESIRQITGLSGLEMMLAQDSPDEGARALLYELRRGLAGSLRPERETVNA